MKILTMLWQAVFYVVYHALWFVGIILFALMALPCAMFDENWK